MYQVKNITEQPRKVRDRMTGVDVIIEPGKAVTMKKPPVVDEQLFEVGSAEEKPKKVEEKKIKPKEEDEK